MIEIIAIYGSPRYDGNSAALLKQAVAGAQQEGAHVEEVFLRDYKISPCFEIYNCIKSGECAIRDDFPKILAKIESSNGIMLASPIFFYTVSAHTKIFMDRFQSLWARKTQDFLKRCWKHVKDYLFRLVRRTARNSLMALY